METLQRVFWHSTFNPLVVFAGILLAFLAFQANSTERVILLTGLAALLAVQVWRARARRRADGAALQRDDTGDQDGEGRP